MEALKPDPDQIMITDTHVTDGQSYMLIWVPQVKTRAQLVTPVQRTSLGHLQKPAQKPHHIQLMEHKIIQTLVGKAD